MTSEITAKMNGWLVCNEERFNRFEDIVERITSNYRILFVSIFTMLYLIVTVQLTKAKLIWTDEFFTLYLARLRVRELWAALLTGGDQHPASFYLVHHFFLRIFGEHSWVLRLPSVLGFLMMMLCVYQFVARRTSTGYGLAAMLLPLATISYEYAYEARGYSLLLGFLALAVLCWQNAAGPSRRTAAIFGLAIGLTGAILSHYYIALLIPMIAAAEAVRSIRRKSWDISIWLAIGGPVVVFVAFFPIMSASSRFAGTFWAKASLNEINSFYQNILGSGVTCLVCSLALAGLYCAVSSGRPKQVPGSSRIFPVEEIVLAVGLGAAPVISYLFGKLVTGVFAWRYSIGGAVGIAIIFGLLSFRLFRGSTIAAWLIVLVITGSFLLTARRNLQGFAIRRAAVQNVTKWLASTGEASKPLIIADSQAFYELSYYSPPALKARYIYLSDTKRALKYLRHDTLDRSLSLLAPWFGLNVQLYESYVKSHHEMTVWWVPNSGWNWLTFALVDEGKRLTVIGRKGEGMLFFVDEGAKVETEPSKIANQLQRQKFRGGLGAESTFDSLLPPMKQVARMSTQTYEATFSNVY